MPGTEARRCEQHQPWASLIACGLKTIQTRDWPPPMAVVGERIAIHAGKRPPDSWEWNDDLRLACEQWNFDMPLGAVVATARLAGVYKVTQNPRLRGWEPDYGYVLATSRLSTPEHREIFDWAAAKQEYLEQHGGKAS